METFREPQTVQELESCQTFGKACTQPHRGPFLGFLHTLYYYYYLSVFQILLNRKLF